MPPQQVCSCPSGLQTVEVRTEREFQNAVRLLKSNMEIRIAAGTYLLSKGLEMPRGLSNVVIRGSTGNRDDVRIQGRGIKDKSVPYGIWMSLVNHVWISDLTIQGVYFHALILNEESDNVTICNVHLGDSGQQILKSNPRGKRGNKNGIVETSLFDFTTTSPDDYARAIDIIAGSNWVIRDNVFRNIRSPEGARLLGPTVLLWKGARNSIVERNQFYNCHTGIAFGLMERQPNDHSGGIIRNNFFYRNSSQSGYVGISVADSPFTKVFNNTIILNGTYKRTIEYRFRNTRGIEIINNLTDGPIVARDGATGTLLSNLPLARPDWFILPNEGNVHLNSTAAEALDHGKPLADVTDDIDGQKRPSGNGVDIGADEASL